MRPGRPRNHYENCGICHGVGYTHCGRANCPKPRPKLRAELADGEGLPGCLATNGERTCTMPRYHAGEHRWSVDYRKAEQLYEAMLATKRAADKRIRDEFQARYGSGWKCRACGAWHARYPDPGQECSECSECGEHGTLYLTGYSPPPEG